MTSNAGCAATRTVLVPLAVMALLAGLFITGAQASHPGPVGDEEIDHLMLRIHDLEPGETHRFDVVSSTHGDPRPGWIYTFIAHVEGNQSLDAELRYANEALDTYTWQAGTTSTANTKIQNGGQHEILIMNPGEHTVRYAFYYDQSCNCESKRISLPQGVVMFNYPFQEGATMDISYPLIDDWHVYGALATHDDSSPTAHWPDDFEILDEKEAQGPGAGEEGWGWLNFTFTASETGMHFIYIEALSPIPSPEHGMMLGATIDLREEAPGPAAVLLVFGLALGVAGARRLMRRA